MTLLDPEYTKFWLILFAVIGVIAFVLAAIKLIIDDSQARSLARIANELHTHNEREKKLYDIEEDFSLKMKIAELEDGKDIDLDELDDNEYDDLIEKLVGESER